MVFMGAMGKVHSHNVQTSLTELIYGLDRVRLWTNGTDDRSPAIVLGGFIVGVELAQPLDLGRAKGKMFHCRSHGERFRPEAVKYKEYLEYLCYKGVGYVVCRTAAALLWCRCQLRFAG